MRTLLNVTNNFTMNEKDAHIKTFFGIRCDVLVCLFLVIAILAVYLQVKNHAFVNFDDGWYVSDNYHVKAGLTLENLAWAFTDTQTGNWHPLTRLSHMLDVQLYGMNPGSHHMTNVLFHIVNTLLLFLVFWRMTGSLWRSAFVAALFAIHPLHVESVAWVSERKDVLSTFFWLLTMWSYVLYVERPGMNRYLTALLFFILGLMAKSMLVTLPFVLLLLDYWPLGRIRFGKLRIDGTGDQGLPIRRLIIEKIPFFALSAAVGVVTLFFQHSRGAVGSLDRFPLTIRIANTLVSYIIYIGKMFWPVKLAAFYPHPGVLPWWQVTAACLLLVFISFLAIRYLKHRPWFIVGWLWYIGTFVPVIGLVQVGYQAMADRYTYVPLIGLFVIAAWGVPDLVSRLVSGLNHKRIGLAASTAALFLILMIISWFQVTYWKNSITLFKHALDVTDNNYLAYNGLGNALMRRGKVNDAIIHLSSALEIKPDYAQAHNSLGNALKIQGRTNEAIDHYLKALEIKSDYAEVHYNLGHTLLTHGRLKEAIVHYSDALRIRPDYAEAHNHLGYVLMRQGKIEEAINHFRETLRIKPDHENAKKNLKNSLTAQESSRKLK